MKAIIYERYGSPSVLKLKEVEKPIPKDNEVLVEIHAASVNAGDWHVLRGTSFLVRLMAGGILKPKHHILGDDIAGRVKAVGKRVTQFKPDDEVFGFSNFGAFAEYRCVSEEMLVIKPKSISYEDAASLPVAGITALQALCDYGKIQSGQKVLISGASGGVGTFAVQIAKSFGAEVTGVCSTKKLDMVHSIGADYVIDYTKEDFTKNKKRYDLIIAISGYHPILDYKNSLTSKGIYVCVGGTMSQYFQTILIGSLISKMSNKKMVAMMAKPKQKDLILLAELFKSGKVVSVIDKNYKLDEVAKAILYYEKSCHKGKIIIRVKHN